MRVTGGRLAGRRISAPRGPGVRPTTDRVRESLFGRLGPLEGQTVLDVFAGSGALGIEALSRGAERAVFLDKSAAALERLRANLADLGLTERSQVLRGDARTLLRRLSRKATPFDLVLMDPPYGPAAADPALAAVAEGRLLAPQGMLVVEVSRRHPPGGVPGLEALDERTYGDTLLVRYTAVAPAARRDG